MGTEDILPELSAMRNCGEYSDLTIRTTEGDIKVHKIFLCKQSPFFANAVKEGRFKESDTGVIDLSLDNVVAVKAMLDFMYTGSYDLKNFDGNMKKGGVRVTSSKLVQCHLEVFALADRIEHPKLKKAAEKWLELGLKQYWDIVMFTTAVESAYAVAPPGASGDYLRTLILKTAAEGNRPKLLLENQGFTDMMERVGSFGKDFAKVLTGNYTYNPSLFPATAFDRETRTLFCFECKVTWTVGVMIERTCPCCKKDTRVRDDGAVQIYKCPTADCTVVLRSSTTTTPSLHCAKCRVSSPRVNWEVKESLF